MTYSSQKRLRAFVYVMIVFLAMPPGFGMNRVFAASRTASFSREGKMETFRNPQFSSGVANRFLYPLSPTAFVGGGGQSLRTPASKGYGVSDGPPTLWLPNGGRVEWSDRDLSLPGVGLPLTFERIWRGSMTSYEGPLGNEWEFNWNKRLFEEQDSDVVFYEMGREETYDESGGSYTSPAGRYDTLAKDTGADPDEFTRTDKWGVIETYEDEGSGNFRLTEVQDLNDNTLTYAYDDSNDRLTKVTDTLGQDTTLAYHTNGRITTITDHDSRAWTYAYHTSGQLTAVTTPISTTTTYKYDASDRLTAVKLPMDTTTDSYEWEYDGSGDMVTQTMNGSEFTLSYDTTNKGVTVNDREGNQTRYFYDSNDLITLRGVTLDGTERRTTYSYNSDAEVTEVSFSRDNELEYTYDSDGNILTLEFLETVNDLSPVKWIYSYTSNSRLDTLKDPNGNTWDYDYDNDSNLTKVTAPAVTVPSGIATADKNGNSTYDGTIETTYDYGSTGLVTSTTDPVGTITDYTYTTVNSKSAYLQDLKQDTGAGGLTLVRTYAYDAAGNITSITDPEGNVTTRAIDDLNRVTMEIEPLTVSKATHYDSNNRVTKTVQTSDTAVGADNFQVFYEYDPNNRLTKTRSEVDSGGTLDTTLAYDGNDRLTRSTSPDGMVTTYDYDVRGQSNKVTHEATSGDAITETTYDGNGNPTTRTDPRGFHTSYAYDKLDRLTKVTQPESNYRTMAYDEAGNLTKTSSYNAGATKMTETTKYFDEANRLYKTEVMAKKADLSTDIGDGQRTKTVWRDERGSVLEYSGDVCGCSDYTFVHDAVGRRVTTKDPMADQNLVIVAYDKNSNVTKRTLEDDSQDTGIEADKDIVTDYVFDARDRMVTRKDKISGSLTAETIYAYGKRDQLTKVTDPEGRVAKTEYNELLWKTKTTAETAGADVITEYTYDDDGNPITYRAKNSTTSDQLTLYTYDDLDRVVTTTWPDTGKTIQTYDVASNRISTTDPNGTVLVCAYDKNNRLTAKDMTLATNVIGVDSIDYGYDGMDRVTSADAAEGTSFTSVLEWTYNTLGKKQTEKQIIDGNNSGNGYTTTYDWNVKGQKTGVTYPISEDVITYDRDNLDRVDKISRGSSEVVDYTYSGKRVLQKEYPGSKAIHTYDGYGRLTKIHHKDNSSGNTLAQIDYGYDDSHLVIWMDKLFYDDVENTRILDHTSDEGDQYAYDGARRLVTVLRGVPTAYIQTAIGTNITNADYDDKVEYHYDQTGNRVTREIDDVDDVTYEHNKVNEMTKEDTATLTYAASGNFTGTSNAYKYDWQNRLASRDVDSDTITWHRDALGRTVQRDYSGRTNAPRTYYDGLHRIEATTKTESGEVHRKTTVFGERIDEILLQVDVLANPDVEYYAHADRLGSVMVMAESDGDIAESYRYAEFGEPTVVNSSFTKLGELTSPIGNSVWYTGRRHASAAAGSGESWYDYRARHMRADTGRFVQRDPIFASNLYSYVNNDPISNVDPSGELSLGPGGFFGKAKDTLCFLCFWACDVGQFGDWGSCDSEFHDDDYKDTKKDFEEGCEWYINGSLGPPNWPFQPGWGKCPKWKRAIDNADIKHAACIQSANETWADCNAACHKACD